MPKKWARSQSHRSITSETLTTADQPAAPMSLSELLARSQAMAAGGGPGHAGGHATAAAALPDNTLPSPSQFRNENVKDHPPCVYSNGNWCPPCNCLNWHNGAKESQQGTMCIRQGVPTWWEHGPQCFPPAPIPSGDIGTWACPYDEDASAVKAGEIRVPRLFACQQNLPPSPPLPPPLPPTLLSASPVGFG